MVNSLVSSSICMSEEDSDERTLLVFYSIVDFIGVDFSQRHERERKELEEDDEEKEDAEKFFLRGCGGIERSLPEHKSKSHFVPVSQNQSTILL